MAIADSNQGDFRIIYLNKEESDGTRKIVPCPGFEYKKGERVLLIDDLVTKAHTKIEAIRAIEKFGSKVVGLVVLVDREQGGKQEIESAGYKLISCFIITELLDRYLATGKITEEKHRERTLYIQNN